MKKHLNTLFVTTNGAYLAKQGESVCIRVEKEVRLRVPLINLDGIVCFGKVGCSPSLFGACADAGVTISFLTLYGKFLASVVGYSPGNVLLRRAQYRAADSLEQTALIARNIVSAKIANSRGVMLRGARESRDSEPSEIMSATAKLLVPALKKVLESTDADSIRGFEGSSARTYFEGFNSLLKSNTGFVMNGRTRRPPLDPTNALLSFIYSLLCHDVRSACEAVGLDAAVGFLHRDRPGRPSLALDLMEELRPFFADRLVASLINRGQVVVDDFERSEAGGFSMSDSARKTVLVAYQKRKEDEITHPFINEKISIGLLPHIQARLLARHLRGDLDEYPAFVWN